MLCAAVFRALQGGPRQGSASPGEQRGQALLWGTAQPALALPWPRSHPQGLVFHPPQGREDPSPEHASTEAEQAALEKNKGSISKPRSPPWQKRRPQCCRGAWPAPLLASAQQDEVLQGCPTSCLQPGQ